MSDRNMFSATTSCKIVFDETTGLPKAVSEAKTENVVSGALKHITSHFNGSEVVTGLGRTIGASLMAYGSMVATNRAITGSFRWNPFSAE